MMDGKYYINSKTNSILKNSVKKNNRDVIATIVYNELTDLFNYIQSGNSIYSWLLLTNEPWLWEHKQDGVLLLANLNDDADINTKEAEVINNNIARIHKHLYTDKPFKFTKYCELRNDCCKCEESNSLPDCFILGLIAEDGTPLILERIDNGILLLEKQRESECYGKELICNCCDYGCCCNNIRYTCSSTLQLEPNTIGSFLWDCDTPILLESQELCDGEFSDDINAVLGLLAETNDPLEYELDENGIILLEKQLQLIIEEKPEWMQNTSELLKGCLDVFKEVYRPDLYNKEDLKCSCKCCCNGVCSLYKNN